jgi:uncharacterized protein YyaL (SSP411 family)
MPNRLAHETSPYLLQHQENPVDWYPWGPEALERATSEGKPILLSIGYSACHWCHVMAHESFENAEIARFMNENFVNIKVDREERPDLDHIYQNVAQAMTRSGGWPLTVFLTPDRKPFFGGTYFPPEDRYGRPGFPRLLQALSTAFRDERAQVDENAEKLTGYIEAVESLASETKTPGERPPALHDGVQKLVGYVDWKNGGFGGAPKFPNPMMLEILWRYGREKKSETEKRAVLLALEKMAAGGIYDHLGGGFHRYSVDETWSVPHFEKMLYDNGLLLSLYSEVALSGDESVTPELQSRFIAVLLQTTEYLAREMQDKEGGFYSAQDADSEGEEGKFFVWSPKLLASEVGSRLSDLEKSVFSLTYGIDDRGNFEEKGETVLHLSKSYSEVAAGLNLKVDEVSTILGQVRKKLLVVRSERVWPGLDHKILTSWNGLAISGLAWASAALAKAGHVKEAGQAWEMASRAFQFVTQKMAQPGKKAGKSERLFSTSQKGEAKHNGYLDDYAFMARAGLDLVRFRRGNLNSDEVLRQVVSWIDAVQAHFSAEVGYFFTSDDHEKLINRPKTLFDQAIPSGNSVVLECLAILAELDIDGSGPRFEKEFERHFLPLANSVLQQSYGSGAFLSMAFLQALGPVVVSVPSGEEFTSVHPRVFVKPIQSGPFTVCHRKSCGLPLSNAEAVRKAVSEVLASNV